MAWLVLVLPVAFFYLGSRATITRFVWSRYPRGLATLMDCPACSGFWYGAIVAYVLRVAMGVELVTFAPGWHNTLWCAIVSGWITMLTTPIGMAILQRSLEIAGTTVLDDEESN